MKITDKFLNWLDSNGRKIIIYDRIDQDPYLERYYLFLRDRKKFPFNVFLHKFLKSDLEDVHDHPWPFFRLIIKGGYREWVPVFDENGKMIGETSRWCGPGHFKFYKATDFHRVELVEGITPWTIFVPGPQEREWGFLANNKWISHLQYLQAKYEQSQHK